MQSDAPFADPEGRTRALYGARDLRTCLREVFAEQTNDAPSPRSVAASTYELDACLVVAPQEIDLLDLESSSVRERLARDPTVARALRDGARDRLDRSALLASSGLRALTQAVTHAALRGGVLDGTRIAGLCVPGPGEDDTFVIFSGDTFDAKVRVALAEPLTPNHHALRDVAAEFGLTP